MESVAAAGPVGGLPGVVPRPGPSPVAGHADSWDRGRNRVEIPTVIDDFQSKIADKGCG